MEATTPNSVAPTMLRVVDSVVLQWCANGCNNMQQGVQRDITCTNIQQCSVRFAIGFRVGQGVNRKKISCAL